MSLTPAERISVRWFQPSDFAHLEAYFFDSPIEFLRSIGLRDRAPGAREEYRVRWQARIAEAAARHQPVQMVIVLDQGEPVGFHSATHVVDGESMIMHAHYFRANRRGLGLGRVSYVLALELFFQEFGFKEILFKTPLQNVAAIRIKDKLGLSVVGTEVLDWELLHSALLANIYRVTPEMVSLMRARVGLGT